MAVGSKNMYSGLAVHTLKLARVKNWACWLENLAIRKATF